MSANIPFKIQEEIIKRVLPFKSLLRFRSISKQWKPLIHSSRFITRHSINQTHPYHLLIWYTPSFLEAKYENKYVSIVDDDSFPHHKFSPSVPPTVNQLKLVSVLGCSHGLVCLLPPCNRFLIFWNPSIRKSVGVVLPDDGLYVFGFGVCPKTLDLKVVKIPKIVQNSHIIKAEVYTLRSGVWRKLSMNRHAPCKSMKFLENVVDIDGVIYWAAFDCYRIVRFDLTSEKFGEVDLPDSLAGPRNLDIFKLKESLVVLDYGDATKRGCDVWMMQKSGVPKSSFTKLFTIEVGLYDNIIGFRNNGQPMMYECDGEHEAYEPDSRHMNGLGVYGRHFRMASYTDSLLLLNHPHSINIHTLHLPFIIPNFLLGTT